MKAYVRGSRGESIREDVHSREGAMVRLMRRPSVDRVISVMVPRRDREVARRAAVGPGIAWLPILGVCRLKARRAVLAALPLTLAKGPPEGLANPKTREGPPSAAPWAAALAEPRVGQRGA